MTAIISILVFTMYVLFVWIRYGVQKSISDSYYRLKNKAIFTLALWGFAVPAMIAGNTLLMVLAGAGICFVGAAADFNKYLSNKTWHMVAAFSGIIFGMLSMWLDFGLWWIPVIMAVSIPILIWKVKNYIWWIEVLAFYLILLGLLIK